jgi:hypothetical protein
MPIFGYIALAFDIGKTKGKMVWSILSGKWKKIMIPDALVCDSITPFSHDLMVSRVCFEFIK